MSGSDPTADPFDEFDFIARRLRPLAAGAPEALGLADDAAVLPSRPGFDLVVTQDAIVEGVHFLPDDPPDTVARKLLRVNLSDLTAKGAEPYGYFLTTAWPDHWDGPARDAFVRGLAEDQAEFGLRLFGGDTVATPGPATFSVTMMGWVPAGRMVRRSGARAGDVVFVTGTIGDGWLGLAAARGDLPAFPGDVAWLADRYRIPRPPCAAGVAVLDHARSAADVSDGLLADAGHIAEASGVAIDIDLAKLPLSDPATRWLGKQTDQTLARAALAAGGDDYQIVGTCSAAALHDLAEACRRVGVALTAVGEVREGQGVRALQQGQPVAVSSSGYRHRL